MVCERERERERERECVKQFFSCSDPILFCRTKIAEFDVWVGVRVCVSERETLRYVCMSVCLDGPVHSTYE